MIKQSLAIGAFAVWLGACGTPAPETSTVTNPSSTTNVSANLTAQSNSDFATTTERLESALSKRGLTLFTVVDHSAGATEAGLSLEPSKLYIFGNPKAGTLLMQSDPQMGLQLPLKALVFETNGQVHVSVSDIRAITAGVGISEPAQVISNVENALTGILAEVSGADGT